MPDADATPSTSAEEVDTGDRDRHPSRRRFLVATGLGVGAVVVGGLGTRRLLDGPAAIPRGGPSTSVLPVASGRRLVVLQLGGGNDAVNTLVPTGDGRYRDARPTLAVPEADLIAIPGVPDHGLHPALGPLAPLLEQGRMALVGPVGIEGQSRSHFEAMDTWWTADAFEGVRTGWLGRWLDATGDRSDPDPLRAVGLGEGSPALRAERAPHTFVRDLKRFDLAGAAGVDPGALDRALRAMSSPIADEEVLAMAQRAWPATAEAVEMLASVAGAVDGTGGGDLSDPATRDGAAAEAAGGGPVTDALATAAGLLSIERAPSVIVVGVGGFDTHADQAVTHPRLLADVAGGIASFMGAVEAQGRSEEVLLVTTSEFGRRVAENGSGTDHGGGGVQLVCGPSVVGGLHGGFDLGALVDGDLPIEADARSMYAVALDWLSGGDEAVADELLGSRYDRLGLVT